MASKRDGEFSPYGFKIKETIYREHLGKMFLDPILKKILYYVLAIFLFFALLYFVGKWSSLIADPMANYVLLGTTITLLIGALSLTALYFSYANVIKDNDEKSYKKILEVAENQLFLSINFIAGWIIFLFSNDCLQHETCTEIFLIGRLPEINGIIFAVKLISLAVVVLSAVYFFMSAFSIQKIIIERKKYYDAEKILPLHKEIWHVRMKRHKK